MADRINIYIVNFTTRIIMLLLREMLEISEFDLLCEDFGNLKGIDKNLLKALMTQVYAKDQGPGKHMYVDMLAKNAGQNSEVKDVELKNSKTVTQEFIDNPSLIGAVIYDKVSGKQFGMVGIKAEKTYKTERKLGLAVNYVALSGKNPRPEDIKHHRDLVMSELKAHAGEIQKTYLTGESDYKDSRVAKMVNLIRNRADLWKTNGEEVKLMVKFIYADSKRPEVRKERASRKSGVIPVKLVGKDLEDFKQKAISSLKSRLDAYKRDKLKNTGDSIDIKEFAKEVKKAGFLDRFLVNGYVFNYYDDRINFSKMRSGQHKPDQNGYSDPSYITYRVDDSSKEYAEMRDKYWEGRAELSANFKDDPEAFHREHDKLKKRLKVPPTRIEILLDLEGGAIVPYDVKLDYSGV